MRQHLIHYLEELGYPLGRMSVERTLPGSLKRYDLLILDTNGQAFLLVECKAPQVGIDAGSLDQLNAYMMEHAAPYALLTDGIQHHFLQRDGDQVNNYQQIPKFATLSE